MPRYMVQRTFPERLQIAISDDGVELCNSVVERNAEEGVTWVQLPVDRMTRVSVLDPYFYTGEAV